MTPEKNHFSTPSFSDRQGKPERELPGPNVQFWLGRYNEGIIDQPDGHARVTGPCGDTMEISLRIQEDKIIESRFRVNGCSVSRACASIAAALAKGKDREEAWNIDEKEIAKGLPVLPADHLHCAILARDTLRQAMEKYIKSNGKREL